MYKHYFYLPSGAAALVSALDAAQGGHLPSDAPADLREARAMLDKCPILVTDEPFEGALPDLGATGWWFEVTEHSSAHTVRKEPATAWRRWRADRRASQRVMIHPCGHDERQNVRVGGAPDRGGEVRWPKSGTPSTYTSR